MIAKSVLSLACLVGILVTMSLFAGSIDFREHVFQFLQPPLAADLRQWSSVPPCRSLSPLRVYMYDLPRRFNVGMLNRRSSEADDRPVSVETLPPWPKRSGLNVQHSVEYWMMASLLYSGGNGGDEAREAVRVSDPEIADVFFVPFFSSLSFNTHGHIMTDPETEVDKKLQVDIVDFLRNSKYWKRSSGKDHVVPMHHPNAFRFLRQEVNASILIVADFGRYPKSMSNLRKDVVAPYVHVVESYTDDDEAKDPFESRPTLLFFRGRTIRKDEGFIRAKLGKILSGYNDVRYESSVASEEGIKLSREGMRSSKFCLHLAGDTPSSCRLFDAIVSHCVPVIISDKIELPYEDDLDYSQFSIFFSDKEALKPGYIIDHLRQVPKQKWVEMWRQLKQISHHYEYQYPPKKDDAVNMVWRQVTRKVPAARLDVHRSRRLRIPDWWSKRR